MKSTNWAFMTAVVISWFRWYSTLVDLVPFHFENLLRMNLPGGSRLMKKFTEIFGLVGNATAKTSVEGNPSMVQVEKCERWKVWPRKKKKKKEWRRKNKNSGVSKSNFQTFGHWFRVKDNRKVLRHVSWIFCECLAMGKMIKKGVKSQQPKKCLP